MKMCIYGVGKQKKCMPGEYSFDFLKALFLLHCYFYYFNPEFVLFINDCNS